jgi:hypothetical protein
MNVGNANQVGEDTSKSIFIGSDDIQAYEN